MSQHTETLRVRDARTEQRFFVDNVIIKTFGAQLKPRGIAVYCALCMYANLQTQTCYPSLATIGGHIGMSHPTVQRAIKDLIELGLLSKEKRYDDGGRQTSNLYTLLDPPRKDSDTPHVKSDTPTQVSKVYTNNPNLEQSNTVSPKKDSQPAGVPAAKSSSTKKKRTLSATQLDHNEKRATLLTHFEQKTGHDLSVLVMGKAAKARLWWNPVRALLVMCDWDLPRAKRLINATLQRLDGLTIADPNSLIKTAQAILAEGKCSRASAKRPPPRDLYYPNDPDYMEQARV